MIIIFVILLSCLFFLLYVIMEAISIKMYFRHCVSLLNMFFLEFLHEIGLL